MVGIDKRRVKQCYIRCSITTQLFENKRLVRLLFTQIIPFMLFVENRHPKLEDLPGNDSAICNNI